MPDNELLYGITQMTMYYAIAMVGCYAFAERSWHPNMKQFSIVVMTYITKLYFIVAALYAISAIENAGGW